MAKEIAPICEVAGLPLPILPPRPCENGAFLYPRLPYNIGPNNHHPWFNEDRIKKLGNGGAALQSSRIQNIDWYYHKNFHEMFGDLSKEIPIDDDGLFKLAVSAIAGVIPKTAVDVSRRGEYEIVELTQAQQKQIASKTTIDQKKPIARFLADYAIKQEITEVIDEIKIEEFLDERTDFAKKYEIARQMLGGAIDLSLENLGLYSQEIELRSQGLIVQEKPKTFYWTAKSLVRNHFDYFTWQVKEQMEARLATQF